MDNSVITADSLKALLKNGEPLFFLHLRHASDWDSGILKARGAVRLDEHEVEGHLEEIPRDRTVIVYSTCPGDGPALRAAALLREKGWPRTQALKGGLAAYLRAGLPAEEIDHRDDTKKIRLL